MDYDPQGSCLQWLRLRPENITSIHGANAAPPKGGTALNSLKKWVPVGTEMLVIDAPAGVKGLLLQEMVRKANFIVIPVTPSPIDIHATTDFLRELFQIGGASNCQAKIAIVANRVRENSPAVESLRNFLNALRLPFIASISDSDNYLRAAQQGLGVFEMSKAETREERRELLPILQWVDGQAENQQGLDDKVVSIDGARKVASQRSGRQG